MRPSDSGTAVYHIRVRGQISARWAEWLDGMAIAPAGEDGETLLTGAIVDQAALLGLLQKLHNLGLRLVEMRLAEGLPPKAVPGTGERED